MEEETATHKLGEVQLLDGTRETENSEYVKEIHIRDDSSRSGSEEESKLEEKSSEFVEEEKSEKKQEEVSDSFVETGDLLQAVENPVENLVESEKIEEKLSESLDDCNWISSTEAEIVSNGTKEPELAASEEEKKNEESAGVVDLASEGKIDDLLQEAVVVPAVESRAIDSQIPETTAYPAAAAAAVDTSNVSEHQIEPEIPESTGYQVSVWGLDLYSIVVSQA